MKKILSYILIFVIVFVNLFAPFSVGLNYRNIIKTNVANAEYTYSLNVTPTMTDKDITLNIVVTEDSSTGEAAGLGVISLNANLQIKATVLMGEEEIDNDIVYLGTQTKEATIKLDGGVFSSLDPNTAYKTKIELIERTSAQTTAGTTASGNDTFKTLYTTTIDTPTTKTGEAATTGQSVDVNGNSNTIKKTQTSDTNMPECLFTGSFIKGTIAGCFAQIIYYVVFVPTSYLFALAGIFFDNTFAYSVQDTSYRSAFVTEGWGLIRDFCNMFFIFILLYTAIATILDLHSAHTAQTIKRVIIIGLFINFSLFITQVIIDASNVTARVFYNADTIKITQGGNNTASGVVDSGDSKGVISLSAGLVNKVNPQNMIINSKNISSVQPKNSDVSFTGEDSNAIGAGTFIVVTLLAAIINIVGLVVFISVGLVFVSRIVGLWIAMIVSPLAFFTYILPEMENTETIGWKNWWSNTLKMSFLAPVFIFFLYIILKFLEIDLWGDIQASDGIASVIAIFLPFAFIMVLLLKAKDIATKMSGEMGQKITGAIAAGGGLMLGGAAAGTAFLGRKFVGGSLAKMSKMDGAVDIAKNKIKFNDELEKWEKANKAGTATGPKPTWEGYKQQNNISDNKNPLTWLGSKLNEKQLRLEKVDHARHEMDEAKKSAGLEGISDTNLSGADKEKIQTTFAKNKKSDIEANVRKGTDGKKDIYVKDSQGNDRKGEEAWKAAERRNVSENIMNDVDSIKNGDAVVDANGQKELTDIGKKKVENQLNAEFNLKLKDVTEKEIKSLFKHIEEESKQHVGMMERGFARANKASFDVRNLSQVKADKREGLFTKIPTALIGGVAMGVRAGLKSSGVNHGQGQKNFAKDFGSLITDALKGVKIEVPKPSGGGSGGHDSHGGGGGGHH